MEEINANGLVTVTRYRFDKETDNVVEDPNGGIKVTVSRPNITREERIKRINHLANTMSQLLGCQVTLTLKE
jgi:hypothetical protein